MLSWTPSEREPSMNSPIERRQEEHRQIDRGQWEPQLVETVQKTLEDLTFTFATPEGWEAPVFFGDEMGLGVAFKGHFEGYLYFVCAAESGREMTVNMLGLDDEETVPPEQIEDALKEVINIICGNILPVMAGAKAVFNIAAPEIQPPTQAPNCGRETEPVARIKMDLDGEPSYLFLFIDDSDVATQYR